MPLDDLKNMTDSLSKFDWGKELETIVENNTDSLVTLQEEQLYSGKDKNGAQITLEGRGYARETFNIKTAKGQPTDRITWSDTKGLYNALQAAIEQGNITFSAPGEEEKFNSMFERSGPDVLGLDEENRKQFGNNITLPAIKSVFKEETGLVIS